MGRRRYRIEGRVQGVGFRWWTRKKAQELGLVGRVRNEGDGSVDVRAGGSTQALDALEEALREGPAPARVQSVRRQDVGDAASETWEDFQIERT